MRKLPVIREFFAEYMHYNRRVGQFGEELAQKYLERKGHRIIDANVKTSYKEIDIIARRGRMLVFVEVKTRTSGRMGLAEENIGRRKINNLKKAMNHYLRDHPHDENLVQLDFVAIDIDKEDKKARIKHYQDIY